MNVGDQVVLLKNYHCSAHDFVVDGALREIPTGGEIARVEHVYAPEHYPNGIVWQSVWLRFPNGGKMCTWTACVVPCPQETMQEMFALAAPRRIQLEA